MSLKGSQKVIVGGVAVAGIGVFGSAALAECLQIRPSTCVYAVVQRAVAWERVEKM